MLGRQSIPLFCKGKTSLKTNNFCEIIIFSLIYHNFVINLSQIKNKIKDTKGENALIERKRSRGHVGRKSEKVFAARNFQRIYGEVILIRLY